jgi:hypothetical protein
VRFTPPGALKLSAVAATLWGQERCVSGNDTDKSVNTHDLLRHRVSLASNVTVQAGQAAEFSGSVEIPADAAFSFHAASNEIVWTVSLRLHIPRWPDWREEATLVVRPIPGQAVPLNGKKLHLNEKAEIATMPWDPDQIEVPAPPTPSPPAAARPQAPVRLKSLLKKHEEEPEGEYGFAWPPVSEVADRIAAAEEHGPQRREIVAKESGRVFDCEIQIQRVERTSGAAPEDFREGRTAIGMVCGTEHRVAVQLPDSRNEQLERLGPGSRFRVQVVILKWDLVNEWLELREATESGIRTK